MTDQFPITPPPELVQQWVNQFVGNQECMPEQVYIARAAAKWGADQELEACCEWLDAYYDLGYPLPLVQRLRTVRRPKPPSLKELALAVLENEPEAGDMKELVVFDVDQVEIIRRALEQLDD